MRVCVDALMRLYFFIFFSLILRICHNLMHTRTRVLKHFALMLSYFECVKLHIRSFIHLFLINCAFAHIHKWRARTQTSYTTTTTEEQHENEEAFTPKRNENSCRLYQLPYNFESPKRQKSRQSFNFSLHTEFAVKLKMKNIHLHTHKPPHTYTQNIIYMYEQVIYLSTYKYHIV